MWHPLRAKPAIFIKVSMRRAVGLLGGAAQMNLPQTSSVIGEVLTNWHHKLNTTVRKNKNERL